MGIETAIQWAHHTYNGWIGCTENGPECLNCYAREQNKHWKWNGGTWGPGALRKITSSTKWREPLRWNEAAKAAGERRRVFAFSLADVFDAEGPAEARPFLWELIERCDWLDWLLLTKRPHLISKMVPAAWLEKPRANVMYGTSVGTQATADAKIAHLLRVPGRHFLSMEPLLEAVDLRLPSEWDRARMCSICTDTSQCGGACMTRPTWTPTIDWVITGGESGGSARQMRAEWVRSLIAQCRAAATPIFVKQLGLQFADYDNNIYGAGSPKSLNGSPRLRLLDRHGGDMTEWPTDLRVREFPEAAR